MPMKSSRQYLIAYPAICILIFFSSCTGELHRKNDKEQAHIGPKHTVWVISNNFHTGLIIELDEETRRMLVFSQFFTRYRFADIGWGDEVFYQNPDFRLSTAARAVLMPSPSVVRVEGFNADIKDVITWSRRAARFTLDAPQYSRLCEFINSSFRRDDEGNLIMASDQGDSRIIFYKSPLKYHLFNTCNTWIARALNHAGLDISAPGIITADNLFDSFKNSGEILK